MQVKISTQFATDFKVVKDASLDNKLKKVLEAIKTGKNVANVAQFRKVYGNDKVYKMGVGFYYIVGIMLSEQEIILMRFLHRDKILEAIHNEV